MSIESDKRNTEGLSLLLGANGGGDRDDVLELSALQQLPKPLHCGDATTGDVGR